MRELKKPFGSKKKAVGINLSPAVLDYFKAMAENTGIAYQKLIDLYLLDCVAQRRQPSLSWTETPARSVAKQTKRPIKR